MIARSFRFVCYMFEMMFSFCFRGVTGTGYWFLVSSIILYLVCFMFGFEYHLILSMFYV